MFEVELSPEAREFYSAADRPLARKLSRCFAVLEQSPRQYNNIKRLTGQKTGLWRFRVGDWRVVYRIDDQAKHVHVLIIAHRREVYE
ncbi:MAG: type II toxin-antitoxin system RelE/ParE family toxin [Tepidisphaeraceae bacterium]|jgi:mRNA interferase RelE/StbE